jgi:hypothetical protein
MVAQAAAACDGLDTGQTFSGIPTGHGRDGS